MTEQQEQGIIIPLTQGIVAHQLEEIAQSLQAFIVPALEAQANESPAVICDMIVAKLQQLTVALKGGNHGR